MKLCLTSLNCYFKNIFKCLQNLENVYNQIILYILIFTWENVIKERTVDHYDFYAPNSIGKFKYMPFTLPFKGKQSTD